MWGPERSTVQCRKKIRAPGSGGIILRRARRTAQKKEEASASSVALFYHWKGAERDSSAHEQRMHRRKARRERPELDKQVGAVESPSCVDQRKEGPRQVGRGPPRGQTKAGWALNESGWVDGGANHPSAAP